MLNIFFIILIAIGIVLGGAQDVLAKPWENGSVSVGLGLEEVAGRTFLGMNLDASVESDSEKLFFQLEQWGSGGFGYVSETFSYTNLNLGVSKYLLFKNKGFSIGSGISFINFVENGYTGTVLENQFFIGLPLRIEWQLRLGFLLMKSTVFNIWFQDFKSQSGFLVNYGVAF